jgi:carboxyl-terminal processing protease
MKLFSKSTAILAILALGACSEGTTTPPAPASSTNVADNDRLPRPPEGPAQKPTPAPEEEVPRDPYKHGAAAFNEVRDALLKSYYAEGLTEDDVYRAATAGMLEKLEPRMKKYNKLLSPQEVAEMKNDLKGEVVGAGLQIKFDAPSGYTDVLGVIPGSPAEKGGVLAGDKIVTVDGKLYKGMTLKDVVADIRGPAGTTVTISVLRADKLQSFKLTRERLAYDAPSVTLVDGIGLVRIPSFNEKTPAAVRAGLEDLDKKGGAKALIVDLRHSPGGSFDRALETAELLLPEGSPIVSLKKKGKPEEVHTSKGKPILGDLPAAVLVDENTASGGELLAAALREERHAKIVGTKTFGKWTVQSLDDLPNGWAYKYTVGLFKTPSGKSYEGVGLSPDLDVAMAEEALTKANHAKPEERAAIDVQFRTAKEVLLR